MEELFFNSWVEWYKWIKKERKETNHFNQKTPCNQDCFPFLCAGKEIKPVNPKGNQPWIFIGRTDAEAEASILGPSDAKSQLIGKDLDAGKNWGQEEKKVTEDEMVGWHHWLNECEFEHTLEDNEGQGGLAGCIAWGCKESDATERLNWTELNWIQQYEVFWESVGIPQLEGLLRILSFIHSLSFSYRSPRIPVSGIIAVPDIFHWFL